MKAIDAIGQSENTVVLFASDNGGLSTVKNPGPACNLPLRAGKGWLYEGGIRIPLVVKYTGKIQAASESEVAVTTTDFYPTLLSLANLDSLPNQHLDAIDFSDILTGKKVELARKDLFGISHIIMDRDGPLGPPCAVAIGN